MDQVQKLWMYEHWMEDQKDKAEIAKNHAYLLGSFWNPEAVKELMNDKAIISDDSDYEESINIIRNQENIQDNKSCLKKKRKKLKV